MRRYFPFIALIILSSAASASWYWPFGDDEPDPPRLSELMETASDLIDEASDFAAEEKIDEAVAKYRAALDELNRVEAENPERAKLPEFATLKNKRAYVSAAIDSLLMAQVKAHSRAVTVTDTTELEKRLAAEKSASTNASTNAPAAAPTAAPTAAPASTVASDSASTAADEPSIRPFKAKNRRDQAMYDISRGDYDSAARIIKEMLVDKPNGATALNLKAALEMKQGNLKAAEATLDQAIQSNPRSFFAYYNMAQLMIQKGNLSGAKRYYETGRAFGGAKDEQMEARFQ